MSGDREARILGAGDTIEVGEDKYRLRPLVVQQLCDLERDALRNYKREYLQTYRDAIGLAGTNGESDKRYWDKVEEVAHWDINSLPERTAYDVSRVPLNDVITKWITDQMGSVPDSERGVRSVLVTCLDSKQITPDKIKELTGVRPKQGKVRYDQWWVTANMEGMTAFIENSVRREEQQKAVSVKDWPLVKLMEASRIVESLTQAAVGNTSGSPYSTGN